MLRVLKALPLTTLMQRNDSFNHSNTADMHMTSYPLLAQVDMEEPQLFSGAPDFTLGFEIVYITKEFTHYQMAWHYGWVLITLVFMFLPKIGFFYEMMQLHQNFWSRQQVSSMPPIASAMLLKFRCIVVCVTII